MLSDVRQRTIEPVITGAVAVGSLVHTDEYVVYARLPAWGYRHQTVCHGRGEYARDEDGDGFCEVHVNTAEGCWSPGRLASQAAGPPRLLPVRAQRAPTRQSPARGPRRRLGRMTQTQHPGTLQEPSRK